MIFDDTIAFAIGTFLVLLSNTFFKNKHLNWGLAVVTCCISLFIAVYQRTFGVTELFNEIFFHDSSIAVFHSLILVSSLVVFYFAWKFAFREQILFMLSVLGALILSASADMVTFVLGLELMSLPLYALSGYELNNRYSAEAAVKYFFLGTFSSAFLIYGFALLYGLTGTTALSGVVLKNDAVTYMSLIFILAGVLFKLSLVPFHFWTADTYQGAPTPVTMFLAATVKAAAMAAVLHLLWNTFASIAEFWQMILSWLIVATLVLSSIMGLRQNNLKRLLAYSSINHAGFLAILVLVNEPAKCYPLILFYFIMYILSILGTLAVVCQIEKDKCSSEVNVYAGLIRKNPYLAVCLSIFLLALAGLPPAFYGFMAKLRLFIIALTANYISLTAVAIMCALISCAYYLRVISIVCFKEPELNQPSLVLSVDTKVVLYFIALLLVFIGLLPVL